MCGRNVVFFSQLQHIVLNEQLVAGISRLRKYLFDSCLQSPLVPRLTRLYHVRFLAPPMVRPNAVDGRV